MLFRCPNEYTLSENLKCLLLRNDVSGVIHTVLVKIVQVSSLIIQKVAASIFRVGEALKTFSNDVQT